MRAGRLITMIIVLQRRGRVTAAELAEELEVSERTVLRDIDELSGAGVPVYATRGPGGGFQLLEGNTAGLANLTPLQVDARRPGRRRRASVRITPRGRQLAAVLGKLQPLRVRRAVPPDADGWLEATFRLDSIEGAVVDVLSLGAEIEVVGPPELRTEIADRTHRAARLYLPPDHKTAPTAS